MTSKTNTAAKLPAAIQADRILGTESLEWQLDNDTEDGVCAAYDSPTEARAAQTTLEAAGMRASVSKDDAGVTWLFVAVGDDDGLRSVRVHARTIGLVGPHVHMSYNTGEGLDCTYVSGSDCHGHVLRTLGGEYVAVLTQQDRTGLLVAAPTYAALKDARYAGGERVSLVIEAE